MRSYAMKAVWTAAIVISLSLLFAPLGCEKASVPISKGEVVATVNDVDITVSDFTAALTSLKTELSEDTPLNEDQARMMKLNLLNQLIDRKLLVAEAEALGITVTDEEIDEAVNRIIDEYPDRETFDAQVKSGNIDLDQWRGEIEYKLLLEKLVESALTTEIEITPEDIEAYYEENRDDYSADEKVHALQIMVETLDEAESLLTELENGADFSSLATVHSISPDSARGGDLGFFSRDEMPPDFEIVFEMEPGKLSNVVESPYGFHIFKVLEKSPAKDMTLEEATPEIIDKLKRIKAEEEYGMWFSEIKERAQIEINPSVLDDITF
ncbi:MAG: peptidyl-prolyl cis-trans isomerase [Deltaproteobacteria bacterium]|nr:peptidyl-prolyl cis-trans isomerase [Candidatus Zymogenaceae bacterium]